MSEDLEFANQMKQIASISTGDTGKIVDNLLALFPLIPNGPRKANLKRKIVKLCWSGSLKLLTSERPPASKPLMEKLAREGINAATIVCGEEEVGVFILPLKAHHYAVYGMTGTGKTQLLFKIISEHHRLRIPYKYFDPRGDSLPLLRVHNDIIIIPWWALPWNPLRPPPGVHYRTYWAQWAEESGDNWGVGMAGVNYLLELLDRLGDVYEKTGKFPAIRDLYELMLEIKESGKSRRVQDYFDVAFNRIRMLHRTFGELFAVEVGVPLEKLRTMFCVIDLNGLRIVEKSWLVQTQMLFDYNYSLANNQRGDELKHSTFVDEGQLEFDASRNNRDYWQIGPSAASIFHTQLRDAGESIWVFTQSPRMVMAEVHENSDKIVGNLGTGQAITDMEELLGIADNQFLKGAIQRLQKFEWIVKLRDYPEPFMIITTPTQLDRNVTYEEVMRRWEPVLEKLMEAPQRVEQPVAKPHMELSVDELSLLKSLVLRTYLKLSNRFDFLNMSANKGEQVVEGLIRKNLVEDCYVPLSIVGRPTRFIVPTRAGLYVLREHGMDTEFWESEGHASFEHRIYQSMIAWELRKQQFKVSREGHIADGVRVDVIFARDNRRCGIEIELDADIDADAKLKALDQLDEMLILAKNDVILKRLESKFQEQATKHQLSKIRFQLVTHYLAELRRNSKAGGLN